MDDLSKELTRNGWTFSDENYKNKVVENTESIYEIFLLSEYDCLIRAYVSTNESHYNFHGDYGVLWVQCDSVDGITMENGGNLNVSFGDLKMFENALIYAEENLLKLGIPFTEDYKFHTKNAIKHKKNMTNRKRAKLNE